MDNKNSNTQSQLIIEIVKIIPSILLILFAIVALMIFYSPLLKIIELDRIKELRLGVLQVTMVERASQAIERVDRNTIGGLTHGDALKPLVNRFEAISPKVVGANVLWVDDNHPTQNLQERRVLPAFGMRIDMARSTAEGIKLLQLTKYDVVISDMRRDNDPKAPCFETLEPSEAGCDFLRKVATLPNGPAVVIYSANFRQGSGTPAFAFALTNRTDYLIHHVFDILERRINQ